MAERVELRPADARIDVGSDVMRARCGDNGCPGDSKPGLTAVARSRESERAQRASSTHSLPTDAASRVPQGMASAALLAASIPGHRSTFGCTPGGDEGATKRVALHRALGFVRKQVEASAIRQARFAGR